MTDRQQMAESPIVTGISPKDGIPGTQITIRGENLGLSQNDLVGVNICGSDCILSARWESSRKIVARVNQLKAGLGDVIVTTRSGGKGTCTVQFRLFNVQIGPLQESAVWVDESRTVPALQRESNNASNLVDDDPLQLSYHTKNQKLPDATLVDLYPDGSSNIRLENFVPAWFLLDNYPNASLEELKTGLVNAQRQSSSMGREGPRDFLKSNLSSFVRCVNALSELKSKLDIDAQNPQHWPLCSKVNSSALQANKLFADVLERKERADAARNALSVLQRFKFLFFLPRNIEAHMDKVGTRDARPKFFSTQIMDTRIKNLRRKRKIRDKIKDKEQIKNGMQSTERNRTEGKFLFGWTLPSVAFRKILAERFQLLKIPSVGKSDYALIFNDYTRAKSLFSETDIPLFKEAYSEVEQRVEKFRKALEEKLVEMPSTLDEQKKIIRYLLLLNPESTAGWTCLNASYHWLLGLLWDSQQKHHKAAVESAHLYDDDSDDEQLKNELTHRFYFVESVANVFNTKLQHFYKLGQSYIHGQLSLSSNLHKEDQVENFSDHKPVGRRGTSNKKSEIAWLCCNDDVDDC
uniref:Exocyst complex component 2 n=1 Tax=Romanomermis culicivorax TaxID=13658 RepID=A0A915L479_ROMCU